METDGSLTQEEYLKLLEHVLELHGIHLEQDEDGTLRARHASRDMQKYLVETRKLVSQGKHEEALRRFVWFHNHALEHDPAMYGVRLSFALGSWKALADVYPPAKTALVETRDSSEHTLARGKGSHRLFHDVASMNRALGEDEETISLFEALDQWQPETAKKCWGIAKDAVIGAKRYDLARKYIGNPVSEFTKIKTSYDQNTALYDHPEIGGDQFKSYNEDRFVEESIQLIDVAIALGDRKAAEEIQARALSVIEDTRIRGAIPTKGNEEAEQGGEDGE